MTNKATLTIIMFLANLLFDRYGISQHTTTQILYRTKQKAHQIVTKNFSNHPKRTQIRDRLKEIQKASLIGDEAVIEAEILEAMTMESVFSKETLDETIRNPENIENRIIQKILVDGSGHVSTYFGANVKIAACPYLAESVPAAPAKQFDFLFRFDESGFERIKLNESCDEDDPDDYTSAVVLNVFVKLLLTDHATTSMDCTVNLVQSSWYKDD